MTEMLLAPRSRVDAGAGEPPLGPATLEDLSMLRSSGAWGWVDVRRGTPTAAFSRRDTLAAGYPKAALVAREHGFEPTVRPVGGRLAAFHDGALIVDVLARHPSPAEAIEERFRHFGSALASALRTLGVDARVGAVPGEYCPGQFSVNARGRTKLAGTAQRLTRGSFWLSAVVLVSDPEPVRAVLAATYPHLGQEFDPGAVGAVCDHIEVTLDEVQRALLAAMGTVLPMGHGPRRRLLESQVRVELTDCWEPPRG